MAIHALRISVGSECEPWIEYARGAPVVQAHRQYASQGNQLDDHQLGQGKRLQHCSHGMDIKPAQLAVGECHDDYKEYRG